MLVHTHILCVSYTCVGRDALNFFLCCLSWKPGTTLAVGCSGIVLGLCLLGCFTLSSLPLVSLFFSLNWKITFDQLQRAIRYWNIGILPRRRPLRSWYAFSGARQDSRKCTQAPGAESQATGGGAQTGRERNKVTEKLLCAECRSRAYGFGPACSVCLAVSLIPLLPVSPDERGRRWLKCPHGSTDVCSAAGVLWMGMVGWPTWLESGLSSPPLLTPTPSTVATPRPGEEEGLLLQQGFLASLSSPLSRSPGHSSPADV